MHKVIQFALVFLLLAWPELGVVEPISRFVPFKWSGGVVSGRHEPKVAMYVPIEVEGDPRAFYLQLDTGCESSFLYGDKLLHYGAKVDSGTIDVPVRWYAQGVGFGTDRFPIWWRVVENHSGGDGSPSPMLIGTLGSNVFKDRILILDFPRQAFAVLAAHETIPESMPRPAHFVEAEIVGGRFVIPVMLGDDLISNVMYDTGASSFGLLLGPSEWTRYTGCVGDEPDVIHDTVPSWGQLIDHWRAPSLVPLQVGGLKIDTPVLDKVAWPPGGETDLRLLGNSIFFDRHTVWLDFSNRRLGFMESPDD